MKIIILLLTLIATSALCLATPQAADQMTDSTGTVRHVHGFRLDDKAMARFRTWRREHHGTTRGASWNWDGVFFRLAIDGKQLQVVEIAANAPLKAGPIPEADRAPVDEILDEKAPVPAKRIPSLKWKTRAFSIRWVRGGRMTWDYNRWFWTDAVVYFDEEGLVQAKEYD